MKDPKRARIDLWRIRAIVVCFYILCISSAQSTPITMDQGIRIDRIAVNEEENSIQLYCTLDRLAHIPTIIKDVVDLDVAMSTKDTIAQRLVLKTIQQYTASTIVVTVLPPIQDAIYKGEERLFTIRYTIAGALYSAEKRAVLGSFIRHQDLRPYTQTSVIDLWVLPLVIVVVISIFLIVFRTIYHKYKFKKEHIQQFGAVGSGEDEYLDLFTFETVQDTDQVVVINEEIMLLRSWKRVLQLPEDDETKGKFEAFFKTSKTDTFFPGVQVTLNTLLIFPELETQSPGSNPSNVQESIFVQVPLS